MSDITDKASELEEIERQAAISRIVRYSGESAQDCTDCGLAIASQRQLAVPGCQLCTECAGYAEARR